MILLRKQEEILLGHDRLREERGKSAISERLQQEKASLRKVVEEM